MCLDAITLGYAVPLKRFNASVHSIFQSAVNFKLDNGRDLLTMVASSETDLPQGIRVDTPQGFTFENLQINEQAICRDGILRFGKSPLVIDLRKAVSWECNLLAFNLDTISSMVCSAWRFVWRALNDRQLLSGTEIVAADLLHPQDRQGSVMFHRLADGIAGLLRATASYDLLVTTVASALIGLGPGLTPTGDDLLVGYMAGLWCRTGEDIKRKKYISNLGKTLIELSFKTTDISRSYLYHSALGQVSRSLADLAEAICKGMDSNQLYERANTAMHVGHTSGMDAVTGLLLGLAAWDGDLLI
jgi:hypothetical protein